MLIIENSLPNKIKRERSEFLSFSKGFSIICIVLYHYCDYILEETSFKGIFSIGGAGIYIFFFASGYGLFFSNVDSWVGFVKKRLLKILFPYYIFVTIVLIVNLFIPLYDNSWRAYLAHLTLLKMVYEPYYYSFGGHLWFISTIVQFYLICPFLMRLIKSKGVYKVLVISFILSLVYMFTIVRFEYESYGVISRFFLLYLWVFVLGALTAKENIMPKLIKIKWYVSFFFSLIFIFLSGVIKYTMGNIGGVINDYFVFAGFFLFVLGLYKLLHIRNNYMQPFFKIDAISYTLYLYHVFVFMLYEYVRGSEPLYYFEIPLIIIISVVFSYYMSIVMNKLIKLVEI